MKPTIPLCIAMFLASGVSAVEVKLQVTETEKTARAPAVITTGVPFAAVPSTT